MTRGRLLSCGEFAKFSGFTKDTLIYYDRIGLFKPQVVADNGYRYYSRDQYYDLDLIATLQQSGAKLEELLELRKKGDAQNQLAMLEEKLGFLRLEAQKIAARESLLSQIVSSMRLSKECMGKGTVFRKMPSHRLYRVVVPQEAGLLDPEVYVKAHTGCIAWDMENSHTVMAPCAVVIRAPGANGELQTAGMLTPTTAKKADFTDSVPEGAAERSVIRLSSGLWAMRCSVGTTDVHGRELAGFLSDIANAGYGLKSDVFAFDDMNVSDPVRSGQEYEARFCAKVL